MIYDLETVSAGRVSTDCRVLARSRAQWRLYLGYWSIAVGTGVGIGPRKLRPRSGILGLLQ
jgi:hypothetical protein